MYIYDTFTQTKKELKNPGRKILKLFVCGPTVYDYSHIGHARTYIVFDAFVKYLRSQKFNVFYLQNITDVDDKIITRAKERKINPLSLAREFEKKYLGDIKKLKITSVNKYARASEHINEIQKQIKTLIKNGFAYQTKSGVYFEVKKFKDYGKLSKQNLNELKSGTRIESEKDKKNVLDFALWKTHEASDIINQKLNKQKFIITKSGEPLWQSPWGWGRPGWHIEDTAITEKYLGAQYDIHGGGNDLKFPHHEAEIAQQESASGKKPLVKVWMHTGFLLVEGEKMSKSLNNFITINDFLKNHSPEVLRLMVLFNHYRSPFNYTEHMAEQTEKSLKTITDFFTKLEFVASKKINTSKLNLKDALNDFENNFYQGLEDDFNTPKALASIFDFISTLQKTIWQITPKQSKDIKKSLEIKLKNFDISFKSAKIPVKITDLTKKREICRESKQFIQSDALRKEIEMLGYLLEDTPLGPYVRKNF
ncbi:cysteine--tRNA ligase [Candidatus Wolfebacteria bacterium CG10_big_fil_rev_8_21_14_0_10_31_9]|uniref:Cysteine--tRNA ligase n=1 Tax=Candidatus Wolfebacteria bacterium CG10_big_fil_rev_8_21_14_0_10_31_9 TaxID=1975070 RepID=A0A2H0RBZ8_9BACT|nr:MAG: cysteine--tRNA ligase [Candidatus Wolfebacteria bacterium CG10_big_fil_rev_8_21_14_0_10_31_9]